MSARASFPTASVPAPGRMGVDFEERVDFGRLRDYRLARARAALDASQLGALLLFDMNNVRYVTSTTIGEWARDKIARFALLTRSGEPHLWDFGSAAKKNRIHAPWLLDDHIRGGMTGLRGAVPPAVGLFDGLAAEVADILRTEGVAGMPLGVDLIEPPMWGALTSRGVSIADGQQVMLDAREIKSQDEIMLLSTSAALVDGVYQMISEVLKPGIRENEVVALATKMLYDLGSDDVEGINAISGERCSPHPHVFSDRLIRPGDQAYFDIIQSYIGYRTCYYRTFAVGRATQNQRDAYKQAREWMDVALDTVRPGVTTDTIAQKWPRAEEFGLQQRDGVLRAAVRARRRAGAPRAAGHQSPQLAVPSGRDQGGDGLRAGDLLSRVGRPLRGAHRGGGRGHRRRLPGHHALPRGGADGHERLLAGRQGHHS